MPIRIPLIKPSLLTLPMLIKVSPSSASVAERVPKLVLSVVFSAMVRLPVRVASEGVSSLISSMSKVKFLLKVCELASVTLTVILRFLVVS
jgi:hypothetical protein